MRLRSACLTLLLALGACGHQPAVVPHPAQPQASPGQIEITGLEKRIAQRKSSLLGAAAAQAAASEDGAQEAGGGRCDSVCVAAEEICTCYRRICRLASDINDDKSAESCRRSERECEEAARNCASCH